MSRNNLIKKKDKNYNGIGTENIFSVAQSSIDFFIVSDIEMKPTEHF